MHRITWFSAAAFAVCCAFLCGCSAVVPANECLIQYRKTAQSNSSVLIDGTLCYAGNDGIYDQENQLVLRTEEKPLLMQRGGSVFTAVGTTVTEYDTAFQKKTEYKLPEQPSAFAVSESSIFFTDTDHVPHVTDKQTKQGIPESKPEITVPLYLEQKPFHVHYYPDFTVLIDPEGGVTAFDQHDSIVCTADLQTYSEPVLSVSDERLIYGTQRRITTMRLISCPLSDPENEQAVKPEGYTCTLEQFLCSDNEIIFTATGDEGVRYSPEDLRGHTGDCYCKIDTRDMHIITQYLTKQYERILYADADKFVMLHGGELQTRSAETGHLESKQKTDLFLNGGNFTVETGPDTIYVFDNTTGRIAEVFSVGSV